MNTSMNTRAAEIGDTGVLLGREGRGSVATLVLQVGEGERALLHGDWRMVGHLVAALGGEWVEVVAAEGSDYGAHGIRPLREDFDP